MGRRRLTRAMLLGVTVLLLAERSYGQRGPTSPPAASAEVIATAVPAPAAPPSKIQQAAFVPETAPAGPPTSVPPPNAAPPIFTPGAMVPPGPPVVEAPPAAPPSAAPSAAAAVALEVTGPAQVTLGQPLLQEIVVRNTSHKTAAAVHVEEPLPAGARLLRSEPPATTRENRLVWELGTLQGGEEKHLKVQIQPGGPGEMQLKPVVSFQDGDGLRTKVMQPLFGIELTADRDKVVRGGRVTFSLRIVNHGQTPIANVKLFATLPPGLHHPAVDGSKKRAIGMSLGDLQGGEGRPATLEATAIQAGANRFEVVAQADGGIEARASREVQVIEPSLALQVEGPKQGTTRRNLDFHLEISNPSPTPARRLRLVQSLPASFEVLGATTGANLDTVQHALVWSLPDLGPNQRQTLMFRVQASQAGDWPLYTAVVADDIPETRVANVLHLEGAAALRLEVRAREEVLAVGGETVYEMHIFNQGDAPCTGVRLTAALPEEVTPFDGKGPTAGQIDKQQVTFAPLDKLPARGQAVYQVRVRGKQNGSGQVRVALTADKQPAAQKAVSIQVHGGPAASGTMTVRHNETTPIENGR